MSQIAKGIFQSIAVCYQATVERITKFISVFAEYQQCVELSTSLPCEKQICYRSVAYTLNAGGVKLWRSANVISSSTLSGHVHGGIPGRSRLD
jgi:hypothetical protein